VGGTAVVVLVAVGGTGVLVGGSVVAVGCAHTTSMDCPGSMVTVRGWAATYMDPISRAIKTMLRT